MTVEHSSATTNSGSEQFKLRLGTIAWFLAAVGLLLSFPVLVDIGWIAIVGAVLLASVLAFPVAWLVRKVFAGQRLQRWWHVYSKSVVGTLAFLGILVATPIYGFIVVTAVRPQIVPQATLSNGTKTVIFQGMIHIGSEGFYKSVVYDVEKALSEGYVIFYEGVTSDPEGDQWFSDTLAGGGDLSTNYTQMSDICGINFQLDYFGLLDEDMEARPDRHIKADVSTADMKREYERLEETDPAFAAAAAADQTPAPAPKEGEPVGGGLTRLFAAVEQATPGQRELVGIACRGWLSYFLGQKTAPSALDPVILDFRNRELAKRIEEGPNKIFVTYGADHLPGLLKDLQAADPAWALGSVKWMRGIDTPEDLAGQI
jgi:hypothetical protein